MVHTLHVTLDVYGQLNQTGRSGLHCGVEWSKLEWSELEWTSGVEWALLATGHDAVTLPVTMTIRTRVTVRA